MPLDLSNVDKYKYTVKVLLKNSSTTQSEVLDKIGFSYTVLLRKRVEIHKMSGVKLTAFFLEKQNRGKTIKRQENCVINYIWSQVKHQYGFKQYTYNILKDDILRYVDDIKNGISTYEIIDWSKTHEHVSVHTFDCRYKKFVSHNTLHKTKIVLCYIVKDHHLQPNLNKDLKRAACEANKGGTKNLLKNMNEYKWTR